MFEKIEKDKKEVCHKKAACACAPCSAPRGNISQIVGNQALKSLYESGGIQTKLEVGEADDKYEHEADAVADKVVRMPENSAQARGKKNKEFRADSMKITPLVQRQVDEETVNEESEESSAENAVQAKLATGGSQDLNSEKQNKILALRGGGKPLSSDSQEFFSSRMGHDFSRVRVHTGSKANDAASAINARAFTLGNDIVFKSGEFSPNTNRGKHLLAHELTHTIQQLHSSNTTRATPKLVQRKESNLNQQWINALKASPKDYGSAIEAIKDVPSAGQKVLLKEEWVLVKADVLLELFRLVKKKKGKGKKYKVLLKNIRSEIKRRGSGYKIFTQLPLYTDGEAPGKYAPLMDPPGSTNQKMLRKSKIIILKRPKLVDMNMIAYGQGKAYIKQTDLYADRLAKKQARDKKKEEKRRAREAREAKREEENKPTLKLESVDKTQCESGVISWIKSKVPDWAKKGITWLEQQVEDVAKTVKKEFKGYELFTLILGRDPISCKTVNRSPDNLVRAFLKLFDGGMKIYKQLKESQAIKRAVQWLADKWSQLKAIFNWSYLKGVLKSAIDAITFSDVVSFKIRPIVNKVTSVLAKPLNKIKTFAKDILLETAQWIFEGFMLFFGGDTGKKIIAFIKKAKKTISTIFNDPLGFIKNLVKALKMGFNLFKENLVENLKQVAFRWLFGAVDNITMPKKFNLKGILSTALQVLGITKDNIVKKLKKQLKKVGVSGGLVDKFISAGSKFGRLLKKLFVEGPKAAWAHIKESINNLKEKLKSWLITKVVTAGITKLAEFLFPALKIFRTIYDFISTFIENGKAILQMGSDIFDAVGDIAAGKLTTAAQHVKTVLVGGLGVALSLIVKLVGLGGIPGSIRKQVNKVKDPIDKGINKVLGKVVKAAAKWLKKIKTKIVNWWQQRKVLTVKGKTITVYSIGTEKKPKLMISASPGKPWSEYLANLDVKQEQKKDLEKAKKLAKDFEKPKKKSVDRDANAVQKTKIFNKLSTVLKKLTGATEVPASVIKYGLLTKDSGGTTMTASILSQDHPKGTEVTEDKPPIFTDLGSLIKNSPHYVNGHLLNKDLGGPGEYQNLTPITTSANANHKNKVEIPVKKAVNDEHKVVFYSVKTKYPKSVRRTSEHIKLETEQQAGTLSQAKRKELNKLQEKYAERKLTKSLKCRAYELELVNKKWVQKKDNPSVNIDEDIKNE